MFGASSELASVMEFGFNCERGRFVRTSFFFVDGYAYSRSLCEFFGVVTVNIFLSVNKNDADVIG